MAIKGKEYVSYIRKGLKNSIRVGLKLACDHPLILGNVVFLLILYNCFPSLFAFLVSSSPVIICTALLLGILLSYGGPNLPEIEEGVKNLEIASLKVGIAANDLVIKKDKTYTIEPHAESGREDTERTIQKATFSEGGRDTAAGKAVHDGGVETDDDLMSASFSVEDDKELKREDKVPDERGVGNQVVVEERESSIEKQAEGSLKMVEDVCTASISNQRELVGPKVGTLEDHFDSSLGSPWQPVDSRSVCSDSESDRSESYSPDASMTDIIPMLDELDPLLDNDLPTINSVDNSDSASSISSHDHESDDGSAMEEEHQDEEDEAQEDKDDGNEAAVKWTADDQKNLMDLGTSEMERNQRLENLIVKRRVRNNLRYERNLIDLDINSDSVASIEEHSRFSFQVPAISATRRNPFDLLDGSEETMALPPIPGSAPSILAPRRNPFDIPFDQVGQSGSLAMENSSSQDFLYFPQRDMLFRRHESFSLGASFYGEHKQEKYGSRFKPYFVADRETEAGSSTLQRQLSEKSDSKVSSVPESDTASSLTDQDHHKQLLEEGLHHESELLPPVNHDAKPVDSASQSSDSVDSVDPDHELTSVGDDHENNLNTSIVTEEIHQAVEIRELEYDSPVSDDAKLEVIEDKYESSSSSSSEVNDECSKMSNHEESVNLEQATSEPIAYGDSKHLFPTDSKILSGDTVDDSRVPDPVYDSSPSAVDKSPCEDLFDAGIRDLNSISLTSSMEDISEVGSPRRLLQKNSTSRGDLESVNDTMDEDLAFATGGVWVASPNLSLVDQNESRSREIHEIKERDVIKVGVSGVDEDFIKPIAFVMPRALDGRTTHPSSLSFLGTKSSDPSPVTVDASLQHNGDPKDTAVSVNNASAGLSTNNSSSLAGHRATEPEEPFKDVNPGLELRDVGPNDDNGSEDEPSDRVEVSAGEHFDVMGAPSDPQIKQGKSPNGMSSACADNPVKPMELKDGSAVSEAASRHQEPEGFDGQSVEVIAGLGYEERDVKMNDADESSSVASTSSKIGKGNGGKSSSSSSSGSE